MPAWLMAFKALNYITKDSKTLFCGAGHFGVTDKTKTHSLLSLAQVLQ